MTAPFQRCETPNLLVELSENHCQSVRNSITLLVKLTGTKLIITGSIQKLHLFDGFVKELSDVGFLFRKTNNLRVMEDFRFKGNVFWNCLSDGLIKLCFELSQLSSQVNDVLAGLLAGHFQ
jgi:hypothetical protein